MANKGWSILFGIVLLGCAVGYMGWSLPAGVSSHAAEVDHLYYVILIITGFFFFLTEGLLVVFLWRYASSGGKRPVQQGAEFPGALTPLTNAFHNPHHLEMAWTAVPAFILIWIGWAQVDVWANIKYQSRKSHTEGTTASLQVGVSARQFEWRMRYPSLKRYNKWLENKQAAMADMESFALTPQWDDIESVVNQLHIYQNHQVVVHLSTRDVIHSFNLPNFRVKQDALPGKMIPVWFKTVDPDDKEKGFKTFNCNFDDKLKRWVDGYNPDTKSFDDKKFIYDIPCAELCGWGHYRMIGRVYVHENEKDFLDWLETVDPHAPGYKPQR